FPFQTAGVLLHPSVPPLPSFGPPLWSPYFARYSSGSSGKSIFHRVFPVAASKQTMVSVMTKLRSQTTGRTPLHSVHRLKRTSVGSSPAFFKSSSHSFQTGASCSPRGYEKSNAYRALWPTPRTALSLANFSQVRAWGVL